MMTADLVLARLRDAASTGTYTRLHVSMDALDTVRRLDEFKATFSLRQGIEASYVGLLELDGVQYGVHRDELLKPNCLSFVDAESDHYIAVHLITGTSESGEWWEIEWGRRKLDAQRKWEEEDRKKANEVLPFPETADPAAVRADLERRYPGCVFTDAFVQAYAEGRA